ncbi:MAG: ATP-binding cassette domain-containing protein [Candidatus Marinimicrobia bacterium]|nr:ATP-binding cassette domain-containing protein [Candidatus Neomarinimicrobiota bacterium]MDD5581638.1 ATP-binding cassette domain-containing protein [Candidatus Neomarinimicrobiota bacterium]
MIIQPFTYPICEKKTLINKNIINLTPYCVTGICGPVGSGKSTFIKLLVDYKYRHLNIFSNYGFSAYLSQDLTRLFTGNTVKSIVDMYRDSRYEVGRHFQEKDFFRYIAMFDFPFESRKDDFLTDFSEGERQRLAIALTAATVAQTAVYDEPTTALNARYRECFYKIVKQQAQNTRIFIISHRISDLLATCDSLILFKDLHIQSFGDIRSMVQTLEIQKMIHFYF